MKIQTTHIRLLKTVCMHVCVNTGGKAEESWDAVNVTMKMCNCSAYCV